MDKRTLKLFIDNPKPFLTSVTRGFIPDGRLKMLNVKLTKMDFYLKLYSKAGKGVKQGNLNLCFISFDLVDNFS
jgi:hypothetical protein